MPIKFLNWLLKIPKKINKSDSLSKKNQPLPKQTLNSFFDISSIKKSNIIIYISFLILVTFVFLFIFNLYLDKSIKDFQHQLNNIVEKIDNFYAVQKEYTQIANSINFYKSTQSQKDSLYLKTSEIFNSIPNDINQISLLVKKDTFSTTLSGSKLLSFTLLIDNLINSAYINKIYIQDVNLETLSEGEKVFYVNILGDFK